MKNEPIHKKPQNCRIPKNKLKICKIYMKKMIKILPKDIKENPNKWRKCSCIRLERFGIVKMLIPPQINL